MIELTDEMVETVIELVSNDVGAMECGAARDLVAAVLALVERDWNMQPNPAAKPTCTCCGTSWPHAPSSERCTPPVERDQPSAARKGYETAIAVLRGVADRTGSPAAAWCADYLAVDPDRLAPPLDGAS